MSFQVKGELSLDGAKWAAGLSRARGAAETFAHEVGREFTTKIAGLFAVGAMEEWVRRTIEFAHRMRIVADQLGVNVEWLQKMNYALEESGASAEGLQHMMQFMSKARQAAVNNPEGKEAQAFSTLGISPEQVANASKTEIIDAIAKSFKNGTTAQLELAFMTVGGKGAKDLIAAFSRGLDDAGPVISEDTIDILDSLAIEFERLKTEALAPMAIFLRTVIRLITDMIDGARVLFAEFKAGWKQLWSGGGPSIKSVIDAAANAGAKVGEEVLRRDEADAKRFAAKKRARRDREKVHLVPSEDEEKEFKPAKWAVPESSSGVAVGNFIGAATNLADIAQQQLSKLDMIERNTRPKVSVDVSYNAE